MSKEESLAKASKELMLGEPFYGLFLMGLNKIWSKDVPTAGVGLDGINYRLLINEDFWGSLSQQQKKGILKHELLHIAFFHLVNYEKYQKMDPELLNIAMDIEINQYIDRTWLPAEGCFFEDYKDRFNLEPKKGTVYYFEKLFEEKQKGNATIQALLKAMSDGESQCTLPDGTKVDLPSKHDWEGGGELSEAEKKLAHAQTAHLVQQVAEQVQKSAGIIPGEMKEVLKRLSQLDPPKFDWKGYMRRFAGKSVKTYTKKSKRKYNKRIPDNPGLKIKRQKHILVAVDTSASVSSEELKEFLNEMHHMQKTGSEVTVVQCDTAISSVKKFNPKDDWEVGGRGGTSFQPVIDYYNENQRKYSCLFYCTDGEASTPENARGNILWVLSSNSSMNEKLPGQVIKLDI